MSRKFFIPVHMHPAPILIRRDIEAKRAAGQTPTSLRMGSALAAELRREGSLRSGYQPVLCGLRVVVEEDGGDWWAVRCGGDPERPALGLEPREPPWLRSLPGGATGPREPVRALPRQVKWERAEDEETPP